MTAALAHTPSSAVRLRPAPPPDPPYDDERLRGGLPMGRTPGGTAHAAGLAATTDAASGPVTAGDPAGATPVSGQAATRRLATHRRAPQSWQTMANDLPLAIKQFVDMYVEVLNQRRPLRHLLPHVTDEAFHGIKLGLLGRGTSWWPAGRGRLHGPDRILTPSRQPRGPMPIRVRRLRACQPTPRAVEVAAVLARGEACRAVALRLEQQGDRPRWTCTALEFVA